MAWQVDTAHTHISFVARHMMIKMCIRDRRKARGLIFRWASRYQEAVMAGLMSLEESVRLVLCDEDVRPFTGPPGWTV